MSWQSRTEIILGVENLLKLKKSHILIAGTGGVGSWAAEILIRNGVEKITIVDSDRVKPSNRNRQLPALTSTENKPKVEVMKSRLLDINPMANIITLEYFLKDELIPELLNEKFDYVIDAIDTLSPKVFLIYHSLEKKTPIISSMGAGGKIEPSLVQIDDISKSHNCKLARMVRKRLTKLKIKKGFNVVYSPEKVNSNHLIFTKNEQNKKTTVGTLSYMPALFGITAASKVIRDITDF
ncbi:tRNA threonylcarbamoyladenosine dehydratase [Marinilabiliaceae bacterium ANBcel2]|nr:tRNA threonylcarbamoyladenosine dehydratase [Marinilabiliaceae bacterium ANBcel2]